MHHIFKRKPRRPIIDYTKFQSLQNNILPSEQQKKYIIEYYKKCKRLPENKLFCFATKQVKIITSVNKLNSLIEEYKGIENLINHYQTKKKNTILNQFQYPTNRKLNKQEIQFVVNFYNKYKHLPHYKLLCNKTYKLTTITSKQILQNYIKKYGNIYNLITTYEKSRLKYTKNKQQSLPSKQPKKLVNKKNKKSQDQNNIFFIPKINLNKKIELTPFQQQELFKEISKTNTCLRPDIFLNNGRNCKGCLHFSYCLCKLKTMCEK